MQNLAGEEREEENNWDRRCIIEDAQIGGISLCQDRLFWVVFSSAGSLILAPCDNLTAKNHYSRVYDFVWGLECHGPVRIDGWCFSFGKVTYVVVTMAVDTNLYSKPCISSTSPFSHGFYFHCLILFPQFFSLVNCIFSCTDLFAWLSLSRSNLLDQTIALDLTKYIIHETDYVPLKTFIQNMLYIGNNLALRKSYGLFKVKMWIF